MKSDVSSTAQYTCTLKMWIKSELLYRFYTHWPTIVWSVHFVSPGRIYHRSPREVSPTIQKSHSEGGWYFFHNWSPFWSPLSIEPIVRPFFLTVKLLMVTYVWNVNFGLMHRVAQNVHFHKSSNIELCEMPNREVSVWTLAPNKSNIGDFTSRVIFCGPIFLS